MSLRPITQAESDAWDAQPGTDVFGRPWSSWHRVIAKEPAAVVVVARAVAPLTQMELAL